MRILYLTLAHMPNLDGHGIYKDLLHEFLKNGHELYAVSPRQKRFNKNTEYLEDGRFHSLLVKTGNITKCNIFEKAISMMLIEKQYLTAIEKYLNGIKFDLVLYSTPPITFSSLIKYIKSRDNARTYLMLKDIFPQNAVDLGMLSKTGIKGFIYRYYRSKEKELYAVSDNIGCMSPANVEYLLKHNPEINKSKVGLCPNSLEVSDYRISSEEKTKMRKKYNIPLDKKVFIYGGNLGKPQDISFIIECLKTQRENKDVFFFIAGNGTEYSKLKKYADTAQQDNLMLSSWIPREDYSRLVAACDVGLIFLDYRFTIPNFPNRLLAYLQAGLPVLCCTDPNTDIGQICEKEGFGWSCLSNNTSGFNSCIKKACKADLEQMGKNAWDHLRFNYGVERNYSEITQSL